MHIKDYHNIYFIGIGGIGMSAIARYFNELGKQVSGYDKTSTALTKKLESECIDIHYEDNVDLIVDGIDLVIYTPAIPQKHKELNWLRSKGYRVIKRAEALGMISRDTKAIAVAGTHGKTSTSSLITHILTYGNVRFSAFLGGILRGVESNYINHGYEWVVLEADEYDRSFHHLNPEVAVLLSMDPDHLDIYGDHETMQKGFWKFVEKINPGGTLIYKVNLEKDFPAGWKEILEVKDIMWISFGIEEGDARAKKISVKDGFFVFDYCHGDLIIDGIKTSLPGDHNIENAVAALTAARKTGIDEKVILESLSSFPGILRRFERLYSDEDVVYIDDYAHHPTELNAAISAARKMYPEKKITGIFQPHLFSRTKDFADGFAESLDALDEVVLLPIYPARELPMEGVTSEMIVERMKNKKVKVVNDIALIDELKSRSVEIIMTLGAGDIDLQRNKIIDWLTNRDK